MDSIAFLKKHNLSTGSRIELISKKEKFSGIIIPSLSNDSIQLKFSNGYNAGFKLNEIDSIKELNKIKSEKKELKLKQNKNLPKILVLHTGGTIASKVDYELGGVKASFKPEDLISLVPEITELAVIETKQVSNIMSEDMTFNYYKKISKELINAEKEKFKGIIIAHGTDTLAYSSAAMSFALQNLSIPVLFVGSQRSPDRPSTDAAENLLNAVYFISKTDFVGIGICMHENLSDGNAVILSGTKTRKMHSSRRDAFKAINDVPIARVNYSKKLIDYLKNYSKKSNKKIELKNNFEEKTGLLKLHPNLLPEAIDFYRKQKYKGLVLEGTGMGHAPSNSKENLKNFEALKKLINSGTIVVMTTQCIYGRVYSEVYTNLRKLKEIGVIFAEDMHPETAFIKLAWVLGNYPKKAEEKFLENLVQEFNERTPYEFKTE